MAEGDKRLAAFAERKAGAAEAEAARRYALRRMPSCVRHSGPRRAGRGPRPSAGPSTASPLLRLAAARLRYIAGTAWSTKRHLNIELLKDQQMRARSDRPVLS